MKHMNRSKKFGVCLKSSVKAGSISGFTIGSIVLSVLSYAAVDEKVTAALTELATDIGVIGGFIIVATLAIAVIKYTQAAIV